MTGGERARRGAKGWRPRHLTVRRAAGTLGVPQSVIHRAIRLGLIRTSTRHGLPVVRESDVIRLFGGARLASGVAMDGALRRPW
jgi:hypothetical protein